MAHTPPFNAAERNAESEVALTNSLEANMAALRNVFEDCSDVVFYTFAMKDGTSCGVVSVEGLSDTNALDRQVIAPLLDMERDDNSQSARRLFARLPASSCREYGNIGELADRLCVGYPVVLIDGASTAYSFDMISPEQRSIEEPVAESTVRGPRDGFTESLSVNLPLVRKRLKTPNLKVIGMTVGSYSRTGVAIVYMKGIADPALADEIKKRIEAMRIEGLLESESVEEWITDNPFSPFPQMLSTERPDVVCANLLEGRIAVLIDGTPFALVAPVSIFSMLQSPEDYYQNILASSFIRWLRYVFFVMSLLLPSAYVAITTFHQEMIPTVLLLNIAKSREEIPFPALVEALIMEITFEALREAGVRLPKQVGAAVSIVGALVIGQAATSAGIVSAPMVIVVAITGISSFMIPRYSLGIPPRILRFPIMILAGTLGLVGVMLGFILIVIHLSKLRSFGLPYLSPVTPTRLKEWKDVFLRSPIWKTDTKPSLSGSRLNSRTALRTKGARDDR